MERSLYLMVAVLQVLAFGTTQCKIEVEREKRELSGDDLAVKQLLESSGDFLVGEDTPVWYAYDTDNSGNVRYTRESPFRTVSEIKSEWKSIIEALIREHNSSGRRRRSVDESASNMVRNMENWDIETLSTTSSMTNVSEKSVEKQETNDVYHPTILIVMNYKSFKNLYGVYDREIIYALAFWNAVQLQLGHIKDPQVRLRIAGIVITHGNSTVPYLTNNVKSGGMNEGFNAMMEHWLEFMKRNGDFQNAPFDIVATMTDHELLNGYEEGSSVGPPCFESNRRTIAGLLLKDEFSFEGIQFAVKGILKILGAKNDKSCPSEDDNVMSHKSNKIGREWSACTFEQISSTLKKDGWCLRDAKEFYPPGEPLKPFFPGMVLEPLEYCRRRDHYDPIIEMRTCRELLKCGNKGWWKAWDYISVLDGTTCDEGKICLDEKCVSDTILPMGKDYSRDITGRIFFKNA